MSFWDCLTFLWDSALTFLNNEIVFLDVHFTLWQFALGMAVISLLLFAIFRALE